MTAYQRVFENLQKIGLSQSLGLFNLTFVMCLMHFSSRRNVMF